MNSSELSPCAAEFWQFSLSVYAQPGVPAACLELQETQDTDVNILLFCCWMARRGLPLSEQKCKDVMQITQSWRLDVVRPIRAIRRHVGALDRSDILVGKAYETLKTCELRLEQIQQTMLADNISSVVAGPRTDIASALRTFAVAVGIPLSTPVQDAFKCISLAAEKI